jgi:hypothetical protein
MLGVQWCHLHSRTDWPADVQRRSSPPGYSRGGIWITGSTPLGTSRARRMGSASVQLCTAAHSGRSACAAPGSAPSAADCGNSRVIQAET